MGKLISISVFCARRDLENDWTEEDAARQRGLNEWMRMRWRPDLATLPGRKSRRGRR
jgi:hypothetical protein